MSRSYRKPYETQGYGGKRRGWEKRAANRRVRRSDWDQFGKGYRKLHNPWGICDFRFWRGKYEHPKDSGLWFWNAESQRQDFLKAIRK